MSLPMTEAQLLENVLDAAQKLGWRRAHFRPARTEKGWRTPVQGDGKGFPDLILLRGEQGIAVELKQEGQKPKPEQDAWLAAFEATGYFAAVWTPRHWHSGVIEKVLA